MMGTIRRFLHHERPTREPLEEERELNEARREAAEARADVRATIADIDRRHWLEIAVSRDQESRGEAR